MTTQTLTLKKTRATFTVRPTSKGQVTLPKAVRDFFNINQGDELTLSYNSNNISISSVKDQVKKVAGSLGKKLNTSTKISDDEFEKLLETAKESHFKAKFKK